MKMLLSFLLLATTTLAQAWETVLSCDDNALAVDEECISYRYVECFAKRRQLVINNTDIVAFFAINGVVNPAADGRFITDSSVSPQNNGYIVKTSANGQNIQINLTPQGKGLRLEAFAYEEVPGPHGVNIRHSEILADWNFQNCR